MRYREDCNELNQHHTEMTNLILSPVKQRATVDEFFSDSRQTGVSSYKESAYVALK